MSDWLSEEAWQKSVKLAHGHLRDAMRQHLIRDPETRPRSATAREVVKCRSRVSRIYASGTQEWQERLGDPLSPHFTGLTWLDISSRA